MLRSIASNFLTFLLVALVLVAALIAWGQGKFVGQGPSTRAICLKVPRGGSIAHVAEELQATGAISNAMIFRLGAEYAGRAAHVKAGSFLIPEGASMQDIVTEVTGNGQSTCGVEVVYRISVSGQEVRVRELNASTGEFAVTAEFDPASVSDVPASYTTALNDVATRIRIVVAEGVTSWQVVEALKVSDLLEGEVGDLPEEGSLAPDGYEIVSGASRRTILDVMRARQQERLDAAWLARSEDAPVKTPEEALILASIIEKETGRAEERPLVASVFANRLRKGIRLQTDPTVIYGITEGRGGLGRGLRQSELRRDTPWNTYLFEGLPPTPIANPGKAAIEAALSPAESDYLFFVADGTGGHAFAETLREHNANVARWRRFQADQAGQ
ncbi:MAG: endolytic transglycosylase MltG [Boseongicola sp. SB0677_bin_26]|nr:endolytic transglycosylase MltG [Boseongicola sp. SB0665_bin_10]MYG27989.1 endolytic transglycosylase MltG [Boseongicola sp. SB0677_bin_26]